MDYTDFSTINTLLKEAQDAEHDNREKVREVTNFVDFPEGQWEQSVATAMTGRPMYTFDKTNPIVDSIAGELEQSEFSIKVDPAGGEATKDNAKLLNGIIRGIQANSNATTQVYNPSSRQMITAGLDHWRVTQEWGETDSFEQDLYIRKIANSVDRVWLDPHSEMQDGSDSNYGFVLQSISPDEYDEKWPEGKKQSVGEDRENNIHWNKKKSITVGEFLYKKEVDKELVLMNNNAVYVVDDDYQKVVDELTGKGITEKRRRKIKSHVVMSRLFDGGDWLNEAKETVFDYVPLIPIYGNFKVSENKIIYRGAINHLMDAQRVLNYAWSRDIEDGALKPKEKLMMTTEQAQAHKTSLATMNTNNDPVQFYTHVDGQNPPYWAGPTNSNTGLQQTAANMNQAIMESSGIFAANQGNAPLQSGVAIELQQDKGDTSTVKYFSSAEIALTHTCKILIHAIPKVYDTKRTVRILDEAGIVSMEDINDQILDNESGEMIALNDIRKGKYDVVCASGTRFKSRQKETVQAFLDIAGIDPTIIQRGQDIFLSNTNAPGMDLMAERARKVMFETGQIPDAQMTDEEKDKAQAMIDEANANPPQPSAMDQAIMEQTQANTADIQSKAQERADKSQIEAEKLRQNEMQMVMDAQEADRKQDAEDRKAMFDMIKTQAETLKIIKESMGAEKIINPEAIEGYQNQAEQITESQEQI